MQNKSTKRQDDNNADEVEGFPGMDSDTTSNEGSRSTEEVRKARLDNTKEGGGTHGGSKSPEGKEHHDRGGKEGNNGAHPF